MYDIDRERFGPFVAQLRKERGLTQKELAQRLYVSDKAVSKWERGAGMPDISMLMPLAEALGVTVSELLQAQRMEPEQTVSVQEADEMVQKALGERMNAESRKRWGTAYYICAAVSAARIAMCMFLMVTDEKQLTLLMMPFMALIFGAYLCLFAKVRLPYYYDEDRVSFFSDGAFRMNVPGVYFNNRNWPHVLKALRLWSLSVMVVVPLVWPGVLRWTRFDVIVGFIGCVALLLCVYIPAKKYE